MCIKLNIGFILISFTVMMILNIYSVKFGTTTVQSLEFGLVWVDVGTSKEQFDFETNLEKIYVNRSKLSSIHHRKTNTKQTQPI